MKPFILLPLLLLVACQTPHNHDRKITYVGTNKNVVMEEQANIFIPQQIKTYQLGRYVDHADPNTLHERHTVYRREQSENWNLASAQGAGASRSYYLTADQSQQGDQERAYYEAAQEQARITQIKLTTAEEKIAVLEKENLTLKEKTRPSLLYPSHQ